MAEFSAKERLIASLLSSTPGLKEFIKKQYIYINSILYKKNYKSRVLNEHIGEIVLVSQELSDVETFFGYYDKICEWNHIVVGHSSRNLKSVDLPSPDYPLELFVKDLNSDTCRFFATSSSYNWQQGTRLHWLSEDNVIYNIYSKETNTYKSVLYSITDDKIIREYDYPVQESYKELFFLSINYSRLWNMRPDYCYRNISKLTQRELDNLDDDGIFYTDMKTGQSILLHSLTSVLHCSYKEIYEQCNHNVNHVMCSPDGKRFIFIHRNYLGKRRFDRLIISDFKNLRVLVDEGYVSHCCWIDNHTVFGYLRYNGENGFYFCDVDTGDITLCTAMSSLKTGDGHPSFNGRFIAFDTYPDKSRMQKLFLYDTVKKKVIPLLELYQSIKYMGETRCDLHPRFSHDGKRIYFDTVYNGHRQLCYVNIEQLY